MAPDVKEDRFDREVTITAEEMVEKARDSSAVRLLLPYPDTRQWQPSDEVAANQRAEGDLIDDLITRFMSEHRKSWRYTSPEEESGLVAIGMDFLEFLSAESRKVLVERKKRD